MPGITRKLKFECPHCKKHTIVTFYDVVIEMTYQKVKKCPNCGKRFVIDYKAKIMDHISKTKLDDSGMPNWVKEGS